MVEHTRRNVVKLSGGLLAGLAVGSSVTAAESTDRFIVQTERNRLEESDVTVVHDLREIGYAVVEGAERDVERIGAYVPDVVYDLDLPTEHVTVEDAGEATDEPLYPLQWDKQSQNVPDAHEVTTGSGTRVSIIDSGIAAGHPDLQHAVNTDRSRNFTGDGFGVGIPAGGYHGTHVAGIVAASSENDTGVTGTAPDAELVDCRVFAAGGGGATFGAILAAIVYSARIGSDVANLSLGAYPVPRQGLGSFYGKVLAKTTAYARRNGTLLVVAAGNDGADLQHDGAVISLPNEAENVVSVSATGPLGFAHGDPGLTSPYDTPAVYTNYGTNAIDIAGPGGNYDPTAAAADAPGWYLNMVLNAVSIPEFQYVDGDDEDDDKEIPVKYLGSRDTYSWVAGTSMAAPQVAGAAALVKSTNPGFGPNQVRQQLERTADSDNPAGAEYYGAGVVDPNAAVRE